MRRIAIAIAGATACLLTTVPFSGCGSTHSARRGETAVGHRAVRSGEVFPGDVDTVAQACRDAMTDLSVKFAEGTTKVDPAVQRAGGEEAPLTVAGKTADGRPIKVELRSMGRRTMASVSVGKNGDVPYARALLDRVAVRLGTKPPDVLSDAVSPPPPSLTNPLISKDAVPNSEMLRDQVRSMYRDSPSPY